MRVIISRFFLLFTAVSFFYSCSSDSDNSSEENISAPAHISASVYNYTSIENQTLELVNSYRASIGLNTLEKSNYISIQSEEHDNYMITNNVVSHDHFDVRYNNIVNALGAKKVGENIAYNYSSPKAALDAWLKSPTHKECIEGDYSHFGIAIRTSPEGKIYYTNIFAKL